MIHFCERQPLAYTRQCLTEKKKLNIGYFGGSITFGTGATDSVTKGWRAVCTREIQSWYPDAEVVETNASVGGTGTGFGLFRMEMDLVPTKPDLVFIEFAMNDAYQHYETWETKLFLESIIHRIHRLNPLTDIVFVYTTDQGRCGEPNDNITAFEEMAQYYQYSSVNVGKSLAEHIAEENDPQHDWNYYLSDFVHPSDEGHKQYGSYVAAFMKAALKTAENVPVKPHILPDPVSPYIINEAEQITAWRIPTLAREGFHEIDSEWSPDGRIAIQCEQQLDSWTFTFSGRYLGAQGYTWTDASRHLLCSIDGKPFFAADFRNNDHSTRHVTLASGLPDGEHTATLTNVDNGRCTIDRFFVGR